MADLNVLDGLAKLEVELSKLRSFVANIEAARNVASTAAKIIEDHSILIKEHEGKYSATLQMYSQSAINLTEEHRNIVDVINKNYIENLNNFKNSISNIVSNTNELHLSLNLKIEEFNVIKSFFNEHYEFIKNIDFPKQFDNVAKVTQNLDRLEQSFNQKFQALISKQELFIQEQGVSSENIFNLINNINESFIEFKTDFSNIIELKFTDQVILLKRFKEDIHQLLEKNNAKIFEEISKLKDRMDAITSSVQSFYTRTDRLEQILSDQLRTISENQIKIEKDLRIELDLVKSGQKKILNLLKYFIMGLIAFGIAASFLFR